MASDEFKRYCDGFCIAVKINAYGFTSMSCFDVQQLVRRFQSSYFKINKIDWLED